MTDWTLDLFATALHDFEKAQYRILDGLQKARVDFSRNQIYPHLGELVGIYGSLQKLKSSSDDVRRGIKGRLSRIDLEKGEVYYERPALEADDLRALEDLIEWALPRIREAIEEGRTIFEFVESNLHLEEVGVVPTYLKEGYLLVCDRQGGSVNVLQYTLSIFRSDEERFQSLRTTPVKRVPCSPVEPSPRVIKLSLVEEKRDLPNPATYFFDSDLDFPFEQTMLPVAKRKLLRHLHGEA